MCGYMAVVFSLFFLFGDMRVLEKKFSAADLTAIAIVIFFDMRFSVILVCLITDFCFQPDIGLLWLH